MECEKLFAQLCVLAECIAGEFPQTVGSNVVFDFLDQFAVLFDGPSPIETLTQLQIQLKVWQPQSR